MSTKPRHKPIGDPCTRCGVSSRKHRQNVRNPDYDRKYNHAHPRVNPSARVIGIDGEGQGRFPHQYNYLAAADEFGAKPWTCVPAGERLTSRECLDFILDLPRRALIFGYAFLYDLAKILQDLPNKTLYHLFHEETRAVAVKGDNGKWRITYRPVRWKNFRLNFMNRRLTVERHGVACSSQALTIDRKRLRCDCGQVRRATVWDIFRFFGESFIQSLLKWNIALAERLEEMRLMKEKRGQAGWNELAPEKIRAYCDEECGYLAKLGRALIDAHDEADLHLTQYYGAGSTASALLKKMDVLRFRGDFPPEMQIPLACAFFGGRFENSVVGAVHGTVYNYDISSAYPYQATLLPCLACGVWSFVPTGKTLERRVSVSSLALINWCFVTNQRDAKHQAWGVFPVRRKDGTIVFPLSGQGGWTWKDEFLTARKLNPDVEMKGAWVYDNQCEHKPFGSLPETYRERVRWGKDAKGIVLKLGPNSVYGKVAQSRGLNPPFQSWIWAGNITSGTRAQLLESLKCVKDPWNILMFATDGVWSRERLSLPKPQETNTSDLDKPLGGWEEKSFDRGVFAVRPGIYFPLAPTERELKEVRARGLGKRVLYDKWQDIVKAYEQGKPQVEIAGIDRFVGAKSAITLSGTKTYKRSPNYGEWISHKITVSFKPLPKRRSVLPGGRLEPWAWLSESIPYKKSMQSFEKLGMLEAEQIAEEQPDVDFAYQDFANPDA